MKIVFIENDIDIDEDDRDYIESCIDAKIEDILDVILDAKNHLKEVWKAVMEYDTIFLHTAFIGDSGYLLEEMCTMAIKNGIRNKVILNCRNSDSKLMMGERAYRLLNILMKRNNVKYYSMDSEDFKNAIDVAKHPILTSPQTK